MEKEIINYPIIEALCEFQFLSDQPWDLTIPGLIYEQVKNEFSAKKQQTGIGIGFQAKGGIEQKIQMTPRIQFLRPDGSALIQIGPNVLIINQLKPYPKWENFKPLILDKLEIYRQVSNPKGFKRILLRYINRFEFSGEKIELRDYFNYYPNIPPGIPQIHGPFNVRIEFSYREGRDRLMMTLGTAIPDKPGIIPLVFDIIYVLALPHTIPLDQASDWLQIAHDEVNKTFNTSITEKCKALF
ncbi:MAG: TIGR04255 family protein [Desulfobacterales bacterium]|nr:TIGR04255 family protein [Pseudomonadota bacterium]MCG2770880.1 TIGR04255 family protein [Desulfobacterales bacterium]